MDSSTSMVLSFRHVPFPHEMLFSSQNDRIGDGVGDKEGTGDSTIDGDVINGDVMDGDVMSGVKVSENTTCVVGKISTTIELLKSNN